MNNQATCGCGKMTLAANERMGTLAGGATVTKAFCFDCLTLLESDGETVKVTYMVAATAPSAQWEWIERHASDFRANAPLSEILTPDGGYVIFPPAAAQQVADRAAALEDEINALGAIGEWLANALTKQMGSRYVSAENLIAAARAAVRKQQEVTP